MCTSSVSAFTLGLHTVAHPVLPARRRPRSRGADTRELPDQLDELPPLFSLRGQHLATLSGDLVVAPPSLAGLLHPPPLNPLTLFELVQGGVQRGKVEGQRAAGTVFDQLRQLVSVAGRLFEQGEHDEFRRALLGFTDRSHHRHRAATIWW